MDYVIRTRAFPVGTYFSDLESLRATVTHTQLLPQLVMYLCMKINSDYQMQKDNTRSLGTAIVHRFAGVAPDLDFMVKKFFNVKYLENVTPVC